MQKTKENDQEEFKTELVEVETPPSAVTPTVVEALSESKEIAVAHDFKRKTAPEAKNREEIQVIPVEFAEACDNTLVITLVHHFKPLPEHHDCGIYVIPLSL